MQAWYKRIFSKPQSTEEITYLENMLTAILIFGIGLSILRWVTFILYGAEQAREGWLIFGGILAIYILCFFLVRSSKKRQGAYLRLTSYILILTLGGVIAPASLLYSDIDSLSAGGYLILSLIASLLLGWRTGVIIIILSITTMLVGFALTERGLLTPVPLYSSPIAVWINQITLFAWTVYLIYLANHNLKSALERARMNEKALANSILEQQKTQTALHSYANDLERRITQLQVASDIARESAALQEVDTLLDRAVNLVRENFGFYHAAIFMVDESGEYAVLSSATGESGKQMVVQGHRIKIGEVGIVGHVARSGEPRVALDVSSDALYYQNPLLPETRSELALPLKTSELFQGANRKSGGNRVIGVLDVQSQKIAAFDQGDINILQTMADQLTVAIQNARLFEATRRKLDELAVVNSIATAGAQATSEDELIERTTELIARVFYPDNFGILLFDETHKVLRYHPSYREQSVWDTKLLDQEETDRVIYPESIPLGEGIVGIVARDKRPMRVNDVNLVSFYKNVDQKTLSELCVPIKIHDQLIGVINAESTRAGFFSSDDEQLLDTIAGQLATAIEKIRHYEAARRRAAELESIRQVTLQLTTNLDLKSLLEALMESALQLVTSDTAHIFLFDGQVLKFGAAYWAEGEPQIVHDSPRQNGITYTVARSGQRMVVTDVYKHPLFQDNPWDGAVISLPLRHANRVLGVMNLAYHKGPYEFNMNELRVLELLADQAAIALNNANLFTEVETRARQLADALAQREELDRMKSEFIQNVSHELRTPLAIVRGYVDLLASNELGELKPQQAEAIDVLSRRLNMLIKLVDDLLVYLQAEGRAFKKEPVNLGELALQVIEDFRAQAQKSGVSLASEIPQDPPVILGSYTHLNRLFDNLISNAIKFTPEQGKIKISLFKDNQQAVLQITDTGIGISPDQINRIFDRFYQVDGTTKRRFGGMGLGLALVKEITEAHGGSIRAHSVSNEGSTFTLRFPLIET